MVLLGAYRNKSKVMVGANEVSALARRCPGSGFPHLRVMLEFATNGDVIDVVGPNDWIDEPGIDPVAVAMLVAEAREFYLEHRGCRRGAEAS